MSLHAIKRWASFLLSTIFSDGMRVLFWAICCAPCLHLQSARAPGYAHFDQPISGKKKNSACLCKTLMRGAASLMIGRELFIAQRKNIRSLQVRRGMLIKVLCVEDWPCALTVESRHQSLMSRGARPGGHPTKESCRRPDRHNRPEQSYHVPPTPPHLQDCHNVSASS